MKEGTNISTQTDKITGWCDYHHYIVQLHAQVHTHTNRYLHAHTYTNTHVCTGAAGQLVRIA